MMCSWQVFPCQGYSRVGYRTKPGLAKDIKYKPEDDPRNMLFKQVIRVARILSPTFVLLENVPDFSTASVTYYGSDAGVLQLLERRLGKLSYHTASVLLDAFEVWNSPEEVTTVLCSKQTAAA